MELRQLRYFTYTAQLLSFSEAARQLNITQSTLSQQIKQLEMELGVPLFQRNSHTVVLTEAGRELLPHATATLHCADTCTNRLNDLKKLQTGTLTIGATFSFSPILTETVLTFMKQYPGIRLNVIYESMEDLLVLLEHHEVDFVLSFKPLRTHPALTSHSLFYNHLAAVVARTHPLARQKSVTLEQLTRYDLALPARGLQARNAFDALIHDIRNYHVRIELNEVHILLQLAADSHLVTILSETSVQDERLLCAVPIDSPAALMEGCVHLHSEAYHKASAREFIRLLRESNAVRERVEHFGLGNETKQP